MTSFTSWPLAVFYLLMKLDFINIKKTDKLFSALTGADHPLPASNMAVRLIFLGPTGHAVASLL